MLSRRKDTDRCDEQEIESTGQPGCRRHVVKAREQEGQAQIRIALKKRNKEIVLTHGVSVPSEAREGEHQVGM